MTVFFLSFVYVAMNAILHEFMMSSFSMSRWLDEESPNAIRSRCVGFGLKEPPQLFFDYIPTLRAASIIVIHPIILNVG